MPGLTDRRAGAEMHNSPVVLDLDAGHVIDLHRIAGTADLPSQTRLPVELDPAADLSQDRLELGNGHGSIALGRGNVLDLQDGFPPRIRIAAAIERDERTRLDLGDVIAGLHLPPVAIGEDKRLIAMRFQSIKERAEGGVILKIGL